MNRRKPAYLVIIFLVAFNYQPQEICAQASLPQVLAKPLTIGDTVPDVVLENIINYSSSSARLLEFRDKLVILDFFATWCAACIKQLPKLDSLQQRFPGIQVLLVTHETKENLEAFRKRNKTFATSSLPIIHSDTALRDLFPHNSIPHQVWLSPEEKIVAITFHNYLTAENIERYFATGEVHVPYKNDYISFNPRLPLLQNGNGAESSRLYSSLLTAHIEGAPAGGGFTFHADSSLRRIYHINRSILGLYASALVNSMGNRIVLDVKDSSRYIQDQRPWHQWALENTWCYELTLPANVPRTAVSKLMLQDLNRYLHLNGAVQNREVDCWVLTATHETAGRVASNGGPAQTIFSDEQPLQVMRNVPLSALFQALNSQTYGKPLRPIILDETGFRGRVDMDLCATLTDLQQLKAELKKYGLELQPARRRLPVFVLSETQQEK